MKKSTQKWIRNLLAALGIAASGGVSASEFSIVNGTSANLTDYPWFVTVYSGDWTCGGSLIHPRWVMTAAHCFDPGQMPSTVEVITGRQVLSDSGSGQKILAKRFITHPQFNDATLDNDIALIELNSPTDTAYIKLAPPAQSLVPGVVTKAIGRGGLAAPGDYLSNQYHLTSDCNARISSCVLEAQRKGVTDTDIVTTLLLANGLGSPQWGIGYPQLIARLQNAGTPINAAATVEQIIAGFASRGYSISYMAIVIADAAFTDELRQVDLPIVDNATCQNALRTNLTTNLVCAGFYGTPKDTCQGDSGGPLVARNAQNSDWVEVGIVSWGFTCATNYGLYTKVSGYLDWIGQHIPDLNAERVFMWGENVAAPHVLKAVGNEHSTRAYPPYWARLYAAGPAGLGVAADQNLYFYEGGSGISSLGPLSDWLSKARSAGY